MALYTTTDMMTTVIGFVSAVRGALRSKCGISVAEYRLLALLADKEESVRPSDVTRTLDISPSMTTLTANSLIRKELARRLPTKGGNAFETTESGKQLSREADLVLESVHRSLLSLLSAEHKNTIVVGTQMTVMAVTKANRMKGESFFGEYDTLQAFLIIERVMTETTQSFGLSMNGFRILFRLSELSESATAGELAKTLALAPSAITYAIDILEQDGYVRRTAERLDKRKVRIQITETGANILHETLLCLDPLLVSGIRGATATERRFIQEACELIVAAIRKQPCPKLSMP